MGDVRTCVLLLLVLVNFQLIAGKPFFESLWCDMFCDDDDDDRSTTTTLEDLIEAVMDGCSDCPTRRPPTRRPPINQQPFNLMIPPSNGMNVTMSNNGGSWLMNFIPWAQSGNPAPPAVTPAPPATTPAGTTAAGTTAGSTTAKK